MAESNNTNQQGFNAVAVTAKDNTSIEQNDSFWTHPEIDGLKWNQVFPYELLLVKREGNSYKRDPDVSAKWRFTLPVPPSAMSISMPFPIGGGVQLDGYFEEHGGAPIRNITFNGSLGVIINRGSSPYRNTANPLETILGGTLQNFDQVAQSTEALFDKNSKPNIVSTDDFTDTNISHTTGYYQFQLLNRFFENYMAFKKTKESADYRLALAIWKQDSVYLVKPTAYTTNQDSSSPLEITYTISFVAWKRINLDGYTPTKQTFKPIVRDSNLLGKVLDKILDARRIVLNAQDTIAAVGGDLDKLLFEPIRQSALFTKNLLGVPVTFADLPVNLLAKAKGTLTDLISTKESAGAVSATFRDSNPSSAQNNLQKTWKEIADIGNQNGFGTPRGTVSSKKQPQNVAPGNDPFNNPNKHFDLFNKVQVSEANSDPSLSKLIAAERRANSNLTRLDFEGFKANLERVSDDFADLIGAGSETYNDLLNRPAPTFTATPTDKQFEVLFAFNDLILSYAKLAASAEINKFQADPMNFVAGLASRSGIAFTVPVSKFSIPYPYGHTLEEVSSLYLGSPDRWIEIATLNGLKEPYIDEVGFDLELLIDGNGNDVVVEDSSNLFVGQLIYLTSDSFVKSQRRIVRISKINDTYSIVTLDGIETVNSFGPSNHANLHAFLPDTVNSMMTIFIPSSSEPIDTDYKYKQIPGIDNFTPLFESGGVDLLLDKDGDLIFTPDGDCKYAVGLTNIIQMTKIRLSVVQGTLLRHKEFGIPVEPGKSTADFTAKELLKACQNLFADDPLYLSVKSASVQKQGYTTLIQLGINVANYPSLIPVSFTA